MFLIWTSTTGARGLSKNDCRLSLIFVERWKGGHVKLSQDFHELLECFTRNEVRFLIVGGWALAAHGHPRLTKDLDVWVWAEASNARALLEALDEFGFGDLGLQVEDFTKPDMVIQLGYPPNRVDLLTSPTGVDFETCWRDRLEVSMDEMSVPFIGLEGLKANKKASGRPQDMIDVAILEGGRGDLR